MPSNFVTAKDWFAKGHRIPVKLRSEGDRPVSISIHLRGPENGELITFLHGFPTCSHDYHQLLDGLSGRYRLLLWDYLGYGDSDKDLGPGFSVHQLADIQEDLWHWCGANHSHIVAHDLGDTVLQELAAREKDRAARGEAPAVKLGNVMVFNGGIYPDLHRPVLVQRVLLLPVLGALLSNVLMGETVFSKGVAGVFSPAHPAEPWVLHEMWESVANRSGWGNYHILIRYITDRAANKERWEAALDWLVRRSKAAGRQQPPPQVYFYWGGADPVSGNHVAQEIRRRFVEHECGLTVRKELGHWPFLEDPRGCEAAMLDFFGVQD